MSKVNWSENNPQPSKITPFLWFDKEAEEAAKFYTSVFKNSKILHVMPGAPDGSFLGVSFVLDGVEFKALNGGKQSFGFNESISFFVNCKDQAEVDYFWDKLAGPSSGGGTPGQCGWLKDRYGISWQIIPDALGDYLGGDDAAGRDRAFEAMMKMQKLDVATLKKAYEGK